jgi:shikimate kinase
MKNKKLGASVFIHPSFPLHSACSFAGAGNRIASMNSNIVLIGFMGCGKSSIGRRLAVRLGHQFLDGDELVSLRAQQSVAEIFAGEGEAGFRKRETAELQALIGSSKIVVATGGGAVLSMVNRDIFHQLGVVVWLHADPETLFERATRTRKRPLLEVENPRSTFFSLLESRLPLYGGTADFKIDATGLTHEQTVGKILDHLSEIEKD